MDIAYNKTDGVVLPITNTRISASEYNQIAASLMHIITSAGLTPDAGDNTQLLTALGPLIVETYSNGTSWYRVWSDGWCEQGGKLVVNSSSVGGGTYSTTSLTFLKPFTKLCSYYCQSKHDRFNVGFASDVIGQSASSVEVYQVNDSGQSFTNPYVVWQAGGYIS